MVKPMNTVVTNLSILSLIFAGVIYLCIWAQRPISNSFISIQNYPFSSSSSSSSSCPPLCSSAPTDDLEEALSKASTANNKTVIITVLNKAYAEAHSGSYPSMSMLDLFLESFWEGEGTKALVDHLLIVAVDRTAYDRCKFRMLHCYRLETDGVDFTGEVMYMSDDFIKMMWRRTLFLLEVLRRGYDFVFTDSDVMWLRNPFPRLISINGSNDLLISTDLSDSPWSEDLINTGFYYIRSNNKTISLFERWYAMKDNSTGMKEQDVLVRLRAKGVFGQLALRVKILDSRYFNGFCSKSSDIGAVTTVHANCCRSISAKVADLAAVLRIWKTFKAALVVGEAPAETNGTLSLQLSQHFACWNSWKEPNMTLI